MVTTTYHVKHPLSHGGPAATWWILHHLIPAISSVAIIFLLALSTPWNEEHLYQTTLPVFGIFTLAAVQKIFTRFTRNQINFHTPGYLGRFKINEDVKGSSPAINEVALSVIALVALAAFYLMNPHNETYSALAIVFGWVYSVTNLIALGKTIYTLSALGQLRQKENWWFFLSPLVGLLIVAPLYKSFPAFAGIPANTSLAANLLILAGVGYVIVWGAKKLLGP